MEVVLCTIPYSGTNFSASLFTERGFERIGPKDFPARGNVVYVSHCLKETQIGPSLEIARRAPFVLPIRHPYRIEESWRRKSSEIEPLYEALETLYGRFLSMGPYVLPIDSENRYIALRSVSRAIKIPLRTEWEVVGSKSGTHAVPLEDLQPSPRIKQIMREQSDFWSLYYDAVPDQGV